MKRNLVNCVMYFIVGVIFLVIGLFSITPDSMEHAYTMLSCGAALLCIALYHFIKYKKSSN